MREETSESHYKVEEVRERRELMADETYLTETVFVPTYIHLYQH